MAKRRDKVERLRDKLEVEYCRLLIYIDEIADQIEKMSAGEIYSPYGANLVKKLDALTNAEDSLSEAVHYLNAADKGKEEAV